MFFNALWETSLQRQIPNALLSRVSAYDWLGSAALTPVGFAIAGPIAATVGVERSLWCAAAVIAVAALLPLAVPAVRDLRNEDATPEAPRIRLRRASARQRGRAEFGFEPSTVNGKEVGRMAKRLTTAARGQINFIC
jgi:hypothetical protein